jgi:hypothetical protein
MAHIQMTDRNSSDLESMEELTDGELLAINGGFTTVKPKPKPKPIYIGPPYIPIKGWDLGAPGNRQGRPR